LCDLSTPVSEKCALFLVFSRLFVPTYNCEVRFGMARMKATEKPTVAPGIAQCMKNLTKIDRAKKLRLEKQKVCGKNALSGKYSEKFQTYIIVFALMRQVKF